MHAAGAAALPRETGGILIGFRTEDQIVVTRAIVIADERSTRRAYLRRERRAQLALTSILASAHSVIGYVGEWHTHPADQPPSHTDIESLKQIAAATSDLVALIVLPFEVAEPRPPHAYVGVHQRPESPRSSRRTRTWPASIAMATTSADELERWAAATQLEPKEPHQT
ncbi:Mov34/MPN/PAD-1 family protein [Rhodococcus sp. WAY2]|uniref:Mov34/MPN/PAD-1 family protein n=2 Tax=unclassified Rhodococcus (in: high G+C Gram-positive bacteria) TaxID=192944 RepID=UPI003FA6822D